MPEQARLRVHGYGKVEVELVTACLAHLQAAYKSILVFTSEIERLRRASREFPFPPYPFWAPRFARYVWDAPTPKRLTSLVPRSQHLVLNAVQLNSPGFWEFLGSLHPLESFVNTSTTGMSGGKTKSIGSPPSNVGWRLRIWHEKTMC